MKRMRASTRAPRQRGVTLVELIVFIVIVAIVTAAMMRAFIGTMRGSDYGKQMTQATQLAQQRMELILGRRKQLTYATFSAANYDPCQLGLGTWVATQVCATSSYGAGQFSVSSATSSFANDACGAGTGTNCRLINVVVTGPYGDTLAQISAQVWSY